MLSDFYQIFMRKCGKYVRPQITMQNGACTMDAG